MDRIRSNSVPSYLAPNTDVDEWDNDDIMVETDDDEWDASQLARSISLTATITYPTLSPVISSFHLMEDYWQDRFVQECDDDEDDDYDTYQSEESGTTKFDAVAAAEDCFTHSQFNRDIDSSSGSGACEDTDDSDDLGSLSSIDNDEICIGIHCKKTKPLLLPTATAVSTTQMVSLSHREKQQQQQQKNNSIAPTRTISTSTCCSGFKEEGADEDFFEDIWTDSPSFREYLQSMESSLYQFLTWVQKVEQCRQLELSYRESIALLSGHTKTLLTESFFKAMNENHDEEGNSSWSTTEHMTGLEAESTESILSNIILLLRSHSGEIKTTLTKYKKEIASARLKYTDALSVYCTLIRKIKTSNSNHKRLDDVTIALYISKKVVCKTFLEYMEMLNALVQSTKELLNEQLIPLISGFKSMKYMNLTALDILTAEVTETLSKASNKTLEVDSTTSRSEHDILISSNIGTSSYGLTKVSQSSLSTLTAYGCSVSDFRKLDNDRLSFYIQEKLATYYDSLRAYQSINDLQYLSQSKIRSSSPNPLFSFKNKSKIASSDNTNHTSSLESLDLVSRVTNSLIPIGCCQITAKGYLFLRKSSKLDKIDMLREQASSREEGWERNYFFITKEDGFLRQYYDEVTSIIVANLKTVIVNISEAEKCDLVLQIVCQESARIVTLQAETAIDFSNWIQALKSWNTNHQFPPKSKDHSNSHRSSSFEAARIPSLSSAMTLLSSKKSALATTNSSNNIATPPPQQQKLEANFKKKSLDILSTTNFRLSPTKFARRNSSEALRKTNNSDPHAIDLVLGYPLPVTDCPIDCCNLTETPYDQIKTAQMSGVFKIHKTCIVKSICSPTDHHFNEELTTLYISLFNNGVIHLQTENDGRSSFFHRPIQLFKLSPRDIYPFPDSNESLKHCFVLRPSSKEIYHLIANSKMERDTWVARLKQICATTVTSYPNHSRSDEPSPSPSSSVETLAESAHAAAPHHSVYNLNIRITEARHLVLPHQSSRKDAKSGNEFYCDVRLDNELRALTGCLKRAPTLLWGEEFTFTDISQIEHSIVINIYSRNEKNANSSRRTIYGSVTIPASQIYQIKKIQDEWFDVVSYQEPSILGQLRVGVFLEEFKVFPLKTHQPLIEALTKDLYYQQHAMVYELARKSTDVQQLARNLLRIYEGLGEAMTWIKSLIDCEVASLSSDDVNILFRGNSFFTRVIDNFTKSVGRDFLEEAIQPIIQKICKRHPSTVEPNTSRLSNNTTELTLTECTEIFKDAQDVWMGIQRAKFRCPIEIRQVFEHLQAAIIKKFNLNKGQQGRQYQIAQYTCVSGFVFLRWICPAIISPKQFGLVQNQPDAKVSRLLTLIAKCLMTLASFSTIEQNTKEPWSICLSEFVQNNKYQFKSYINSISAAAEESPAPVSIDEQLLNLSTKKPSEVKEKKENTIDLPLELSKLSAWCTSNNVYGSSSCTPSPPPPLLVSTAL